MFKNSCPIFSLMKVCIGGTFNHLHRGHKQLIDTALKTAGKNGYLFIGITTGNLAEKKGDIASFEQRKKEIETFLHKQKTTQTIDIQPIHDKYGPTIKEDFDAIAVSSETRPTADEINQIRINNKKKPLQIIEIPFVLADDGQPISSTRIRKQEINRDGRRILKE